MFVFLKKLLFNLMNTKQIFSGIFSREFRQGLAQAAQIPAFVPRDLCLARVRPGYCQAGGWMGLGCAEGHHDTFLSNAWISWCLSQEEGARGCHVKSHMAKAFWDSHTTHKTYNMLPSHAPSHPQPRAGHSPGTAMQRQHAGHGEHTRCNSCSRREPDSSV